jgi:hypothetical protein
MPYNTTAIPPRKEVTGQTQLPCKQARIDYELHTRSPALTRRINSIPSEEDHRTRPRYQYLFQQCCLRHHTSNRKLRFHTCAPVLQMALAHISMAGDVYTVPRWRGA